MSVHKSMLTSTIYAKKCVVNLLVLSPLAMRRRSALLKDTLLFEPFHFILLNSCTLLCTGSSNTGLVSVVLDISAKVVVPPPETGREARSESGMVEVVVVSTSPEGDKVSKRPREVVARMSVDCLPKTKSDPNVDGEDVKVIPEYSVQEWSRDRSLRKDQNFKRMGIFGGDTNRSRELVVKLVNVLVQWTKVQSPVSPVVESVLKDKEEGDLRSHETDR